MLKIRRSLGRLIFNMGITIPGKTVFLIETAPWSFSWSSPLSTPDGQNQPKIRIYSHLQPSADITRSNFSRYHTHKAALQWLNINQTLKLTTDTPYCLALRGELWGVSCEYFGGHWPRYNSTALYLYHLSALGYQRQSKSLIQKTITMASQITGVSIICSTVCSGADQRKHQSTASLAVVRGIHRSPVKFRIPLTKCQ